MLGLSTRAASGWRSATTTPMVATPSRLCTTAAWNATVAGARWAMRYWPKAKLVNTPVVATVIDAASTAP
jgi:hypothetical protein